MATRRRLVAAAVHGEETKSGLFFHDFLNILLGMIEADEET